MALDHAEFDLYPGEVLGVIGDNGAGKSTLIKCFAGAVIPDQGEILLDGEPVHFQSPNDAKAAGIETVYQTLAVCPALDIATNLFLGRERRRAGIRGSIFRMLDLKGMRDDARAELSKLGLLTIQDMGQAVETLSGGQRQGVAVARAAAFGSRVIIMDEPTAALGVKESGKVLQLIRDVRDRGLPVILISHNMPHVFEVADRIHIHRLGRRVAVVTPGQPHHDRGRGHHDRRHQGRHRPRRGGSGRPERRRRRHDPRTRSRQRSSSSGRVSAVRPQPWRWLGGAWTCWSWSVASDSRGNPRTGRHGPCSWIADTSPPSDGWTDRVEHFRPGVHYVVGGNSKVYGASLPRLREADFGPVEHLDGTSPAWPFTYADIEPYYAEAERIYGVHGATGDDPTEPWRSTPFPYPALTHEPYVADLGGATATPGRTPQRQLHGRGHP